MKAILFDLDGTLINSGINFEEMKSEIIRLLISVGVEKSIIDEEMPIANIICLARNYLRGNGLPEEEIRRVLREADRIMNYFEISSVEEASLMDGVLETLTFLKAKGLKIGIMTRSCREYTDKILERFKLTSYIDAVAARDDVAYPKPNPEHAFHLLRVLNVPVEEAVLVGDHILDAECARRAGLRFILLSKDSTSNLIKDLKCQVIHDIREIPDKI